MNNRLNPYIEIEARIVESLGEPTIKHPGVMVYQMDCIEAMKKLPAGLVDLTVTSPPYNIGKEYESKIDVENYIDWCVDWIAEVGRISKETSAFWLNVGYLQLPNRAKCLPISYLLWDKVPFYMLQEIVWHYGAGVAAKKFFSPRNEKFLWFVANQDRYTFNLDQVRDKNVKYPNQRKNGILKCNPLGKNPSDVWEIPKITSGTNRASPERTAHPAQFPRAVINRVILACSNPNDVVLDPFMGSGTTAEVAMNCGRFSLGFELDTKYIQIIRDRLNNFTSWQVEIASQRSLLPVEKRDQLPSFDFG
jgi:adenine-specific DNA-methyltransferase